MQTASLKIRNILLALCTTSVVSAFGQEASVPSEKLVVDLSIAPARPIFQAGIVDLGMSSMKFKVWFNNPARERVNLQIQSEGGILFNRQYNDAWYGQVYDMSQLEDGVYYFLFEKGREVVKKKVVIRTNVETQRRMVVE